MIQAGLSAIDLACTGFVAWVIFHEGRDFYFRATGLLLLGGMTLLVPVVVVRGTLALVGDSAPALIRWLSLIEGTASVVSIAILMVNPGLMGYRIRNGRVHPP